MTALSMIASNLPFYKSIGWLVGWLQSWFNSLLYADFQPSTSGTLSCLFGWSVRPCVRTAKKQVSQHIKTSARNQGCLGWDVQDICGRP